ncbi:MAG: hypothetical protein ABSG68_13825 [Thermoguttaceae bacterium]
MNMPTDQPEERDPDDEETSEERCRWQFSLRSLLVLTTIVAVVCSLIAWWGAVAVVAMFGAAAGAFCGALICPYLGCDVVLDDLRLDIAKCLALGGYYVGGVWVICVGLKWLVAQVFGAAAPVIVPAGLLLLFVFTAGLVVRFLWPLAESMEAVIITFGSLLGIFAAVGLCPGL